MIEGIGQLDGLQCHVRRVAHDAEAASRHHHAGQLPRIARQGLLAGHNRILLENERCQSSVSDSVERSRFAARHGRAHDLVEIAHAVSAVFVHELGPLEGLAERAVAQIGAMAHRAIGDVRSPTLLTLLARVGKRSLLGPQTVSAARNHDQAQQCSSQRHDRPSMPRQVFAPTGTDGDYRRHALVWNLNPLFGPETGHRDVLDPVSRGRLIE